jgi:predicted ribosomally synthesized peptide with SipW-like signal peptide
MKKSAAKKTLITSAAAVSLSALLFAGTTYAWFTDSASSGISTVTSGNLKVGFQVWNGKEYVDIDSKTDIFKAANGSDALWEPGHVETAYVRIGNLGSLSLKYELNLTGTANTYTSVENKPASLKDYIEYGIEKSDSDLENTYKSREEAVANLQKTSIDWTDADGSYTGSALVDKDVLLASKDKETYKYLAITAYMPTSVGNEANYDAANTVTPQISCNLYLTAAQTPDEQDSFNENYDKNASYDKSQMYVDLDYTPISSGTIEKDVLTSGPIVLTEDASIAGGISYGDCVIELNGNTISPSDLVRIISDGNDQTVSLSNGTYEISGENGTMQIRAGEGKSSTVTIENMNFISTSSNVDKEYAAPKQAVQFVGSADSTGTVVFKNCVFDQTFVYFNGIDGSATNVNAVFENCTFNMTGKNSPVSVYKPMTGSISFKNCEFNLAADESGLYAVKTANQEYSDFAINYENVTVNASLLDGRNSSVGLFFGSKTILLNGSIYTSYSEFNTAVRNGSVNGITYTVTQN